MKDNAIKYLNDLLLKASDKGDSELLVYIIECVRESKINKDKKYQECVQVLDYLNKKCGTRYRANESNMKFIRARLKDYKIEDLLAVIDKKCKEWKGTNMQMYLRPETLFNATKFETYHNGLVNTKNSNKAFISREYTDEELNSLFDNIDEIEIY